MRKLYFCLGIVALILAFNTVKAQVLVIQDFEDGASIDLGDFPGWDTGVPPLFIELQDPCEGLQSVSVNIFANNFFGYLEYIPPVGTDPATGLDVEISFQYKIIDAATGNPVPNTVNFGTLDLFYSVDSGNTWLPYETIDQSDLPTALCSTHTATVLGSDIPAGSDFAWRLEANWIAGDYFVYIDDFMAVEQVPCIQPINIEVDETTISYDGATITWEDLNTPPAGSYEVVWCLQGGANPDTNPTCAAPFGGTTTVSTTQAVLTGLADGEDYFIYIRAICAPNSEWNDIPATFQTIAIGSDCSVPIVVNGPLPYTDISQTDIYGAEDYSGTPGGNCGGGGNLLDGYEVVYQYTTATDDILTIDVTGLTASDVGVFVYEDCVGIGDFCIGGASTSTGTDLNVNSLFVTAGEDYYIVIASTDANGNPANTDYTMVINGFDCATWVAPTLASNPLQFVVPQSLADFSGSDLGADVTIEGATLSWYTDNNGTLGTLITAPLQSIALADLDCFWVTQNIGTCEGPAVQVCFDEFNCLTDLGGITGSTTSSVCDTGTVSMTASAATPNIYWYNQPTGGEVVMTGGQFTSPNITQTTSYWVTEVFLGEGLIEHQGNPGPLVQDTSTNDDYGLTLDITQPLTIVDVTVYVAGSGNVVLALYDDSGSGPIKGPESFAVTPGTSTSPTTNVLDLGWKITTPGTYYLRKTSGPAMLYVPSGDASFPYPLGTAGSITDGADSNGTTSSYYYFFDWTVTGPKVLCESPRTEVVATVHTTQPTTVTADEYIVCLGATTNLHVNSVDGNYVYTWTGSDGSGPFTGPTVNVTVTQNTTYTVTAVNPTTTCEFVNDIFIEVKGAADLAVTPDQELCIGESVQLTAGGLVYDFEETPTGWTTNNTSTVPAGTSTPISVADWQVVNSPHGELGITSNDNSSFYISEVNLLGPSATSDTELVSPSISMVGVGSASLSFYHYLRWNQNQTTTSDVEVNVDNQGWQPLKSYNSIVGGSDQDPFEGFVLETIDLSPYVGSTLQIRFHFHGGWGWYWAIDNVVITRNFLAGSVSWSPMTDLYFDEQATVPYSGTSTNVVYFNGSQGGTFNYTATLNITNCGSATDNVTVTVYETDPPTTASTTQDFLAGETLGDLEVTGQNLSYYIEDANGGLEQISVNALLVDGTTYYVSQTLNGCEGGTITITVEQICNSPSNLEVIVASDGDDAAQITATWDPPADLAGIQEYRIVITDITDPNNPVVEYDNEVPLTRVFEIVDDLPCYSDFELELFSVCDAANQVYGSAGIINFSTDDCLGTTDFRFEGLTYYPNPTPGTVYFENPLSIEKIEVYDLFGKRIFVKNANATNVPVDFSNLASGTYLVTISVDGAMKVVQVIRE